MTDELTNQLIHRLTIVHDSWLMAHGSRLMEGGVGGWVGGWGGGIVGARQGARAAHPAMSLEQCANEPVTINKRLVGSLVITPMTVFKKLAIFNRFSNFLMFST